MCSSLARLPRLQLESEADVPSCSSPLSVPVMTDGENQLPRISNQDHFTYHLGAAGCSVGTFWGAWPCVRVRACVCFEKMRRRRGKVDSGSVRLLLSSRPV